MRSIIYARVSRAADVSADTSTPRQVANCRSFLAAKGWQEHAVHRDVDRSAYQPGVTREGFEALLREVTTGAADVVVVWKLDRLTRRSGDFERFWALCEQHNVALASVTEPVDTTTPIGLAVVRLLLTFAGVESTVRGERLAAKWKEEALQGRPPHGGRRPFGHSSDLTHVVEHEADLLRQAARRVIDGELLTTVARDWSARGIIGGHGVAWSRAGLRSTLLSARMVGDRSYHGTVVTHSCHAPILDRRTHQILVAVLAGTPKRMRPTRSLLQGILVCGRCGQHLVSSVSSRGRGIYKCPQPPQGCQRISVSASHVEDWLLPQALRQLRNGGPLPSLPDNTVDTEPLRALNRAYFVDGDISRAEWYATRQTIVGHTRARTMWWRLHPDIPTELSARQLVRAWPTLTRSAQRAVLAAIIDTVVVHARPPGGGGFKSERLEISPARFAGDTGASPTTTKPTVEGS